MTIKLTTRQIQMQRKYLGSEIQDFIQYLAVDKIDLQPNPIDRCLYLLTLHLFKVTFTISQSVFFKLISISLKCLSDDDDSMVEF